MYGLLVPGQKQKGVVLLAVVGTIKDREHLLKLIGIQVHNVVGHQV